MTLDLPALLAFAHERGASDLHLSAGVPPVVRIDGSLQKLKADPLDDGTLSAALQGLMPPAAREGFAAGREQDFSYALPGVSRFRVNAFRQARGVSAVFRVIADRIPAFEELGLPSTLKALCARDRGLILLTGPTGCGKSTTLAAMVDHMNETQKRHVLTIEDPIEYVHQSKGCLVQQREVGDTCADFRSALRVAMREDPDVILVGEMRDLETVQLALTAAETGHLVLSTLHTSGAAPTIDRILDIFPEGAKSQVRTMLSESLVAVLSQKLLPRREGKGRALALEILVANTAVRNLIREDKVFQLGSVMQAGAALGMQTLDMALQTLVQQGAVRLEDARKVADDPGSLKG